MLNAITLPRLELKAAVLGAEITSTVKEQLSLETIPTYYWSDSEIVLSWINNQKTIKDKFVAIRITNIQDTSIQKEWRHIPSAHNAADVASRGITDSKFKVHSLWFYGPLFLYGPPSTWPSPFVAKGTESSKVVLEVVLAATKSEKLIYTIYQ